MTEETSEVSGTQTFVYNEHGQLTQQTDARGVMVARTVDELDRVTFVDYPDDSLDIAYTYDDPSVDFSLGRLTAITRDGAGVDYAYDRFGRTLRDGDLTYAYDDNGNRVEIGYPGDVRALYTYDFADRQATLDVEQPGEPLQAIVTASSYEPSGPLASLTLGNGLVETHTFDSRHHPDRITVAGGSTLLDWQYSTDDEGNVTAITDLLDPANNRVFGYHDVQYFLIQGDGPWGNRGWTYDKIGNRLTETRDGQTDTYVYLPNLAGGNSAQLAEIQLGSGGTRTYAYDAAGNQTQVVDQGDVIDWTYDDASRLTRIERASAPATSVFRYDGRSYLRSSAGRAPITEGDPLFCDGFESGDLSNWMVEENGRGPAVCLATVETEPVYSSGGVLHALLKPSPGSSGSRYLFYFGGRPVVVSTPSTEAPLTHFVSVDHLGAPVLAATAEGSELWGGGFEPFGEDYSSAAEAGVFLRFPGQWEDETWSKSSLGIEALYNGHRWYGPVEGRYSRSDPLDLGSPEDFDVSYLNLYQYSTSNPLVFVDPTGLITLSADVPRRCRNRWEKKILPRLGNLSSSSNCSDFFCEKLNTDFRRLIDEAPPFVFTGSGIGGEFNCDPLADPSPTLGSSFGSDAIDSKESVICKGDIRTALHIIVHELGHFADCENNGDAIGREDHSDGCGAEVACFGYSASPSVCGRRGFPSKFQPWDPIIIPGQ